MMTLSLFYIVLLKPVIFDDAQFTKFIAYFGKGDLCMVAPAEYGAKKIEFTVRPIDSTAKFDTAYRLFIHTHRGIVCA